MKCWSFSCVGLFVSPWTVAHQAPLSMEFSRQEYWGGLPFPLPGDLPHPGGRTWVSCIAGRFLTVWATREAPHLINEERILKFHHRHSTTFNQSSDSDCGRHWLPMSPKSRGACASGWRYTSPVGCFLPKTEPQSSDTPTQYWLPGGIKHSECGQAKWECALSVTYIPEGKNLAWKKAWKIP